LEEEEKEEVEEDDEEEDEGGDVDDPSNGARDSNVFLQNDLKDLIAVRKVI